MTIDFARYNYLRERIEGGEATRQERDEWLLMREAEIAEQDKRLLDAETDYPAAFEQWVGDAISDLQDRTRGLAGEEMIEAGRRFWVAFENRWGEEAARKAWMFVQPRKREGRGEWQSIPPPRPRAHHMSAHRHYQAATVANRADLHATRPAKEGGTISKEEAAENVLGEGTVDPKADPSRQIRRIKARRAIRD